ncbi:MAG: cytochrome c [Bacteroidota bacterium]
MVLRITSLFLVFFLLSCGGNNSTIEANSAVEKEPLSGEVLYSNHCSSCHGADGKLGASGAKDLTESTMNLQQIEKLLKTGRKAMPVMKEILGTEENMNAVSNFVIDLRK